MPKTGTLTKARIVEAVIETNGYTQKKAFETVERIQIPAKALFNIENELKGNTEEIEFQFKWEQ